MSKEDVKKYWLERYKEDKIGTIAKLSQAMQHMAWLREWKRVHGHEARIKPITKKVNGEKVKIGEANIAVAWSELDEFFKNGNEYGDIETVKFLSDKIQNGDTQELTEQELRDLSERENVKWSDGKHSLNPLQGYLYDFISPNSDIIASTGKEDEYGKFYPMRDYEQIGIPQDLENGDKRHNEAHKAFSRFYTTRLMQLLLKGKKDSRHYDFVNFDITSVTTPEQIENLDKKLAEIVQSPEIQEVMKAIENDVQFEKQFYDKLKEEVEIEIKKDSDRIENAHKVYIALETGNLDEILLDKETEKWAAEEYLKDFRIKNRKSYETFIRKILTSDDPKLNEMVLVNFNGAVCRESGKGYDFERTAIRELTDEEIREILDIPDGKYRTVREIVLAKMCGKPFALSDTGDYTYNARMTFMKDMPIEQRVEAKVAEKSNRDTIEEKAKDQDESLDEMGKIRILYKDIPFSTDIDEILDSMDDRKDRNECRNSTKIPLMEDMFDERGPGYIEIDITRRELYMHGWDPSELGWESLKQIEEKRQSEKEKEEKEKEEEVELTSKDIAEADRKKALTKTEVRGIKGLINKIKECFKGKGEK